MSKNDKLQLRILEYINKHRRVHPLVINGDSNDSIGFTSTEYLDAIAEYKSLLGKGLISNTSNGGNSNGILYAYDVTLTISGEELLYEITKSKFQKACELFIRPFKSIIANFVSAFIGFLVGAYGTEMVQKMNGWVHTVIGWFV